LLNKAKAPFQLDEFLLYIYNPFSLVLRF